MKRIMFMSSHPEMFSYLFPSVLPSPLIAVISPLLIKLQVIKVKSYFFKIFVIFHNLSAGGDSKYCEISRFISGTLTCSFVLNLIIQQ